MKKVLLSSVAALAVFAAAAPAFAEGNDEISKATQVTVVKSETVTEGGVTYIVETIKDANGQLHTTKSPKYDGGVVKSEGDYKKPVENSRNPKVKDPFKNGPTTVKTEKTNKHVRVTVLDGGGRPVPGATIDFMYNGYSIGSAVTNVGGDAEIEYLFNEGDVVEFRVGKTATDFKELVTATGSVTVTADMYTNGSVTLPYKLDDRAATINTNSKDVKASDNNQTKEEAKSEAQKTEKAAKAAKDGKAASAQAGKALPKTSAVK